jgi:DNA-binding PadR family transcriptional regulator
MRRFHSHTDHPFGFFAMFGRHRGRGFGRHGGFGGGRGFGGEFPMGRKMGSDQLQLVLLALLAEKPAHGYELIKALDERSNGFYSPSPGMVYPALTYLEEVGHATVEAEGAKKLYRISEEGRAHLEQHRGEAEAILAQLQKIGERMEQVRRAFAGEGDDENEGPADFRAARHALRQAVRERRGAGPEELRRITEILRRAAAEIAKGPGSN